MIHWSLSQSRSFFEESGGGKIKKNPPLLLLFFESGLEMFESVGAKKKIQTYFFFDILISNVSVYHFKDTMVVFLMKFCKFL